MMNLRQNRGHILVKLLIALISVSVVSTAMLNVHLNAGQRVYYEDMSSLMSMQARSAFDRLSYHIKLAGYANTHRQTPLEIVKGDESDTLKIWHNDVQISFFVDQDNDSGALCESIDGMARNIIDGVNSLRLNTSAYNVLTIGLKLSHNQETAPEGIISRDYTTSIKLDNY
jgi:Tfp pilus assembly protein PilW